MRVKFCRRDDSTKPRCLSNPWPRPSPILESPDSAACCRLVLMQSEGIVTSACLIPGPSPTPIASGSAKIMAGQRERPTLEKSLSLTSDPLTPCWRLAIARGSQGQGSSSRAPAPTRHFVVLRRVWFLIITNIYF